MNKMIPEWLKTTVCGLSHPLNGFNLGGRLSAFFFILLLFLSGSSLAQNGHIVSGIVTNENGAGMPGVTVQLKNAQGVGTITDAGGNYRLSIPRNRANPILVFFFIGYLAEEVPVSNQTNVDIELTPDLKTLDQVVVVGYGTQQKKDITGAVSSLSEEDLNPGAITHPLQQISGRAAGVNVSQIGSEPGSAPTVRIRGITSLRGGNDPLVVVDGIQGNMDLLNQVPPSEIESIDILKDASATAVYGSRGAPGVIIVTTKGSSGGKPTVEYSATASVDFIPNQLEVLDAQQWWEAAQETGVPASANHGASTDWYNILTRTGNTQNHTLAFGGGSENFNYRASLSAILQTGTVLNSNNKKYIGRIQATQYAFDDRLTLTMNLNSEINNRIGSPGEVYRASFTSNLITNAYLMRPTDPIFDTDGRTYYMDPNVFEYFNPYAISQTVIDETRNNNLFGSLRADLDLTEDLTASWFGSWRKTDRNRGYYLPAASTLASAINNQGIANIDDNRQDEKLMNISLNYQKVFGGHSVNALALYEWQNQAYQGNFVQARGFVNDLATYNRLQLGDLSRVQPGDFSSYKNDRTLVSFLGRINYGYLDRYLLTISFRSDGSSVFGQNHKWGYFPSAALAWRIDQEPFMQGQDFFDQLKLRGGYGITGNQQGLFPQQSLSLIDFSGVTYFGGQEITNFVISQNANADLQWETRKQANIGIDFAFLDRISGSLDAFTATTDNLLFDYTVPQPPYPYPTIIANVGSVLNRGVEATLSYDVIQTSNTTLSLAGNVTLLENEVLNLNGSINGIPLNSDYVPWGPNAYLIEGQPIGTFYILAHTGTNDVNAETVLDRDQSGDIDLGNRSLDRYIAGSALPTYTYAFTPSFRYKKWDASMVWRGSGGNKIYNGLRQSLSMLENIGRANVLESAVPLGIYTSQYGSDLWLEDGAFLRLDNLNVGYNFQPDNIRYIDRARLSITGSNLILITKYSGMDPELNMSGGQGFGGDIGTYPRVRSIVLGLNVTFK